MNGPHFKEILESVCKSTGTTKTEVRNELNLSLCTLCRYQKRGVPEAKTPYVMRHLKDYLFKRIS